MKKRTLIVLAFVAIASTGIIILNACSKNDNNLTVKKSYEYKEFTPTQDDVIPLIKTFNVAFENHKLGFKSGEDVSLNEAIWTVEAAVNYEYSEVIDDINLTYSDYTSEIIPITYNEENEPIVCLEDIMQSYTDMTNFVETSLNNGEEGSKFVLVDVELIEVNNNSAELKTTLLGGMYSPYSCEVEDEN